MTRADARELAVHLIYSRGFTAQEPRDLVAEWLEKQYYALLSAESELYAERPNGSRRGYIEAVVCGVADREEELNGQISRYAIGWDISRISRLTRAILQLAIYETLYVSDVPAGVAVSEAVRLAKKYDGDDTGAFVNGILGSFVRDLPRKEEV